MNNNEYYLNLTTHLMTFQMHFPFDRRKQNTVLSVRPPFSSFSFPPLSLPSFLSSLVLPSFIFLFIRKIRDIKICKELK